MICPVCGYGYLSQDAVNHGICPSCGTEFGYDDVSLSHEALRAEWLRGGAPWFEDSTKPAQDWDPWRQIMEAFYRPVLRSRGNSVRAKVQLDNLAIRDDIPYETKAAA